MSDEIPARSVVFKPMVTPPLRTLDSLVPDGHPLFLTSSVLDEQIRLRRASDHKAETASKSLMETLRSFTFQSSLDPDGDVEQKAPDKSP